MTRSSSTLKQLDARLQEQALELANLRSQLSVQFKRIAQMQAELDGLPQARKHRSRLLAAPAPTPAPTNEAFFE
jgi:hypothetical protein